MWESQICCLVTSQWQTGFVFAEISLRLTVTDNLLLLVLNSCSSIGAARSYVCIALQFPPWADIDDGKCIDSCSLRHDSVTPLFHPNKSSIRSGDGPVSYTNSCVMDSGQSSVTLYTKVSIKIIFTQMEYTKKKSCL